MCCVPPTSPSGTALPSTLPKDERAPARGSSSSAGWIKFGAPYTSHGYLLMSTKSYMENVLLA